MSYNSAMRNANVSLWAQRVPHLRKTGGALPQLQSAGTAVATASAGWNLTAQTGLWVGPNLTYARQWYRDNATVLNATNSTYAVQAADSGRMLGCRVIASNRYSSAYATALVTVLA